MHDFRSPRPAALSRWLVRLLAVGAIAASIVSTASASPQDMALLRSYVGAWHGEGTLTGSTKRPLICTLTLKQASVEKINYSGRCSAAGAVLSVRGTLAYIDAAKRYEAIMTTNLAFTGVAIGQRRGTGVVFELRENDQDQGRDLTISARIALQRDSITVEFELFYEETGEYLKASVPFAR